MTRWGSTALGTVSALALATCGLADTTASTLGTAVSRNGFAPSEPYGVGWVFAPAVDMTVTQLGVWDKDGDGLVEGHEVGVFNMDGTLVVTAYVSGGELHDGSRFVDVAPVQLAAGTQYYIAAGDYSRDGDYIALGDPDQEFPNDVAYAPDVVWLNFLLIYGRQSNGSIYEDPMFGVDFQTESSGILGPNFRYTTGTVSSCTCELTGDNPPSVDVFDLLAYLSQWFVLDPEAERTGDAPASIDVFDLLEYLSCWFDGCA